MEKKKVEMEIDLYTAQIMYNSDDNRLRQIAMDNFPISDLDPDYKCVDKPKYDVEKDLPTTYSGAISIIGMITRVGPIMSSSTCYKDDIINGSRTDWSEHVFAPDSETAGQLVFLSNALMLMHAWWIVDSNYEQYNHKEGYAVTRDGSKVVVKKVKGTDYENAVIVFSTEKIADKFLKTFNELMYKIIKYI